MSKTEELVYLKYISIFFVFCLLAYVTYSCSIGSLRGFWEKEFLNYGYMIVPMFFLVAIIKAFGYAFLAAFVFYISKNYREVFFCCRFLLILLSFLEKNSTDTSLGFMIFALFNVFFINFLFGLKKERRIDF